MKKILWVVLGVVLMGVFLDNQALAASFTFPPKEDLTWRRLDYLTELRFYRRAVGKINRIAWFWIDLKESYWVPNDLEKYQDWSPVPRYWSEYAGHPKLILAILEEYFLGRLEYGHLIDWENMLAGPAAIPGFHRVLVKKKDKVSSYLTEDGRPIPMPNALNLYGKVWAHGGDAFGPYHVGKGCLNVPNEYAEQIFEWAEIGTPAVILSDWR